jgi:hypothetical protein
MDDEDSRPDRHKRTAVEVVREYLALRREWDISTAERATGWKRGELVDPDRFVTPDPEEEDPAELQRLRAEWCTPAAVARLDPHLSYGTTSEFNPDDLVVLSLQRVSDQEVRLRTREFPYAQYPHVEDDFVLATEYDYVIRLVDGAWRLDQRSSAGTGSEVIRDLL